MAVALGAVTAGVGAASALTGVAALGLAWGAYDDAKTNVTSHPDETKDAIARGRTEVLVAQWLWGAGAVEVFDHPRRLHQWLQAHQRSATA